jgi:hypothetical protein
MLLVPHTPRWLMPVGRRDAARAVLSRSQPDDASSAIGLGPVFWLMISEILPLSMRGKAMAVCTAVNWIAFFASKVPETRDRSLEEIERDIGGDRLARQVS